MVLGLRLPPCRRSSAASASARCRAVKLLSNSSLKSLMRACSDALSMFWSSRLASLLGFHRSLRYPLEGRSTGSRSTGLNAELGREEASIRCRSRIEAARAPRAVAGAGAVCARATPSPTGAAAAVAGRVCAAPALRCCCGAVCRGGNSSSGIKSPRRALVMSSDRRDQELQSRAAGSCGQEEIPANGSLLPPLTWCAGLDAALEWTA